MKQLFSFFLLLSFFSSTAQENGESPIEPRPYIKIVDSILSPLIKSRVPHGILYDRVYPYAQVPDITDGDSISTTYFLQAFSELQRARYEPLADTSDTTFNYLTARRMITAENMEQRLPLLLLHASYATLDTPAIQDGRISVIDYMIYDGPNPASPYSEHDICLPVLGQLETIQTGVKYDIYLSLDADFGNSESVVEWVSVRDITAGTEAITMHDPSQHFTLQFELDGDHLIEHTVFFQGGKFSHFYQWINVAKTTAYADYCSDDSVAISATIPFIGSDENPLRAFGGYGQGEYRIFYNTQNCTKQLRKPIIIVDAWDPGDERKISNFFDSDSKINFSGNVNLANYVRDKGYDVIILNFPKKIVGYLAGNPIYRDGGVDYLERNAMILIELIERTNQKLRDNNSTEQLVVVGPSMGGQIARYGLRYMELNGKTHNTRLWVSFDSPNLGANIPLGFQTLLQGLAQINGSEGAQNTYQTQILAAGARELLIHQTYTGRFFTPNALLVYQYTNDMAPLRQTWKNTMSNMGYPQNLRKIALVNGTSTGGYYHIPGDKMLTFKGYSKQTHLRLVEGESYFMKNNSSTQMCFVESRNGFKTTLVALGGPWVWAATGNNFSDDFRVYGNVSSTFGALDGAPGGIYDVQKVFGQQLMSTTTKYALGKITYDTSTKWTHNSCFIPSVSALGIINHNFDWNYQLNAYYNNICNHATPFDNIYIPTYNQDHITLTQDNVDWLMDELNLPQITVVNYGSSIAPDPALPIACGYTDYTVAGLPNGSNVSWSVTGALQITQINGATVTIRPNYAGATGTLAAEITMNNSTCTKYTARLTTIGTKDRNYGINFVGLANCNWQASISPIIAGDSYSWSGSTVSNNSTGATGTTFYPSNLPKGYIGAPGANIPVYVTVNTSCVSSGYVHVSAIFNQPGNSCSPQTPGGPNMRQMPTAELDSMLTISPNPTTGDWQLTGINTKLEQTELSLKDATGRLIWQKSVADGNSLPTIPGSALTPGIYLLTIRSDVREAQYKLIRR